MWFRLTVFPGKPDLVGFVGQDGFVYWRAINAAYLLEDDSNVHLVARLRSNITNWDVMPTILYKECPKTPLVTSKRLREWMGSRIYEYFYENTYVIDSMKTYPDPEITFNHEKAPLITLQSSTGGPSFQQWLNSFKQDVLGFYCVIKQMDMEKYLQRLTNNCMKRRSEMKCFSDDSGG